MNDPSVHSAKKSAWAPTEESFANFLSWLDDGVDSGGQTYLDMRDRLVAYFDRKNCLTPDDLADETLNRVARRLEEEGSIETEAPAKYCYTVARFVFLESLRSADVKSVPIDDAVLRPRSFRFAAPGEDEELETKEIMLDCLDECTAKLDAASRDLITRYYFGEERVKIDNRNRLAAELSITVNALSIRACRIRGKLEVCVRECSGRGPK